MPHLTTAINTGGFNLKDTLKILRLGNSISNLTLKRLFFSHWEGGRQSTRKTKPIRNFLKLWMHLKKKKEREKKQSAKMTMAKHRLQNSSGLTNPVPAWGTLKSIMENVQGALSWFLTQQWEQSKAQAPSSSAQFTPSPFPPSPNSGQQKRAPAKGPLLIACLFFIDEK